MYKYLFVSLIIINSIYCSQPKSDFELLPPEIKNLVVLSLVNNKIIESVKTIRTPARVNKKLHNLIMKDEQLNSLCIAKLASIIAKKKEYASTEYLSQVYAALLLHTPASLNYLKNHKYASLNEEAITNIFDAKIAKLFAKAQKVDSMFTIPKNRYYSFYCLLTLGAHVNNVIKRSLERITPLFLAIYLGDLKLIQLFVNHEANIHYRAYSGMAQHKSVLDYLSVSQNTDKLKEIISFFISQGFSIDTQDTENDQHSALMHACFRGNVEMVEALVELGADLHLKNRYDNKALHIAIYNGYQSEPHQKIISFLKEKMNQNSSL